MSDLKQQELIRDALSEYLYHSLMGDSEVEVIATDNGLKPKIPMDSKIIQDSTNLFFEYLIHELVTFKNSVEVKSDESGHPVITFPGIVVNQDGESRLDYSNLQVADITPELIDRVKTKLYGSVMS